MKRAFSFAISIVVAVLAAYVLAIPLGLLRAIIEGPANTWMWTIVFVPYWPLVPAGLLVDHPIFAVAWVLAVYVAIDAFKQRWD